jgi:hypothetical protein
VFCIAKNRASKIRARRFGSREKRAFRLVVLAMTMFWRRAWTSVLEKETKLAAAQEKKKKNLQPLAFKVFATYYGTLQ